MERGKVVNCFFDGSDSGFGDFLRGSIHLYELCKYHKLDFDIDIKHHPINKYISSNYTTEFPKENIRCITTELKKQFGIANTYGKQPKRIFEILSGTKYDQINYIFSNFNFICNFKMQYFIPKTNEVELSNDVCNWFQENLIFSEPINLEVEKKLKSKKIKKFNLLHFRLGDDDSFYKKGQQLGQFAPEYSEIFNICIEKFKKYKKKLPIVIISDSNPLKEYIKKEAKRLNYPFYVFHLESGHTQTKPSNEEDYEDLERTENNLFYAVFDMKLVSIAQSAESYSVYDHGSGFLSWVAKIYKVPVKLHKFTETESHRLESFNRFDIIFKKASRVLKEYMNEMRYDV